MPPDETPLYLRRYPDHDTLARADEWDPVTRDVVLGRVRDPPPLRFFRPEEARALQAFMDTLVPQDDRPEHLRVPILRYLDARLHEGRGTGYRYEGTPPDPELWRLIAAALDDEARLRHGRSFADLDPAQREDLFRRVEDARDARSPLWGRMGRMDLVVPYVLYEIAGYYYGHPYGWNEIGFPGPRFPRIWARTVLENPDEPQEAPDARP